MLPSSRDHSGHQRYCLLHVQRVYPNQFLLPHHSGENILRAHTISQMLSDSQFFEPLHTNLKKKK